MAYVLAPEIAFGLSGTANYLVYTYASGGLVPINTWSDNGSTLNANPIVLDSNGAKPIYILSGTAYRFIYKVSTDGVTPGATLEDIDPIMVADPSITEEQIEQQSAQWLAFDLTGLDAVLTADTGLFEQVVKPCTILDAYACSKTGTTTGAVVFDIHGNGTTILGNKITIDATEISSLDAGTQPTIVTDSFASAWRMRIDCDDDGDGSMTGPVVVCMRVIWTV